MAPPPDLDEHEVPRLSRSAHLVSVPRDDRFPRVGRTHDLELSHTLIRDATFEEENVDP